MKAFAGLYLLWLGYMAGKHDIPRKLAHRFQEALKTEVADLSRLAGESFRDASRTHRIPEL